VQECISANLASEVLTVTRPQTMRKKAVQLRPGRFYLRRVINDTNNPQRAPADGAITQAGEVVARLHH